MRLAVWRLTGSCQNTVSLVPSETVNRGKVENYFLLNYKIKVSGADAVTCFHQQGASSPWFMTDKNKFKSYLIKCSIIKTEQIVLLYLLDKIRIFEPKQCFIQTLILKHHRWVFSSNRLYFLSFIKSFLFLTAKINETDTFGPGDDDEIQFDDIGDDDEDIDDVSFYVVLRCEEHRDRWSLMSECLKFYFSQWTPLKTLFSCQI